MYPIWPKIEEFLREKGKTSRFTIDLTDLSPLPEDIVKIPMGVHVNSQQLIENFCWNIATNKLHLRYETWNLVREIFDRAKDDRDLNIFLEMMLIVSKLSVDEYCQHFKRDNSKSNELFFEEFFLSNFLIHLNSVSAKKDFMQSNRNTINIIRQFLLRPVALSAFEDGLSKVCLEANRSKICSLINNMQIYFCKSIGNEIQAITLRNGIIVSLFYVHLFGSDLREEVENRLASSDATILKAWIITKCYHETAHYLAREICGDYNFSTAKFCMDNDPIDKNKPLELGRYTELLLFEMQPDWLRSSEEAARDFINNSLIKDELPLIRKRENDACYLVERDISSLSFAADIEKINFGGCVC